MRRLMALKAMLSNLYKIIENLMRDRGWHGFSIRKAVAWTRKEKDGLKASFTAVAFSLPHATLPLLP